jgi:hypothetical protein
MIAPAKAQSLTVNEKTALRKRPEKSKKRQLAISRRLLEIIELNWSAYFLYFYCIPMA